MIDVFLVRHAESQGNLRPDIVSGQSNHYPLSDLGKEQAIKLGLRFQKSAIQFDKIACSPAVRTRQTLQGIAENFTIDLDKVLYSNQLLELDQGQWVGIPRAEVYTPQVVAQINADSWNFKAPGGESQREVEERMWNWVQTEVLDVFERVNAKVLIVTHGVAIKCLLRYVLGSSPSMTYKIQIDNTAITKISWNTDKGWFLGGVNDIAHLL